ncbi:NACHT, LRR and PYD domains-containing protein 1 homolog [Hypanus sabinus]|uniref:NACHT, LRR and PYD domains-containing protein 1 homolog n=1 Tax=Hypanus sabinus TaxID=79690 RepID=UPI0028C40609|nr:NACHT, LRR and PYD domains-containing protein 1 homolog [Hypanus sabinus]
MDFTLERMLLAFVLFREFELGIGSFSQSYGKLNGDVLLPCTFTVSANLDMYNLVVTWQRTDSLAVVYSFYSGLEHPEHQAAEFRGRTQLFHQEFLKGNANLKLENVTLFDVGNYTCFVFEEGSEHIENIVELRLIDTSWIDAADPASDRQRYGLQPALPFVLLTAVILLFKIRSKKQGDPEKVCLLEEDTKAAIQNYKEYILSDQARSFCTVMRKRFMNNNSFAGSINTITVEEQDPDGELIRAWELNTAKEMEVSQLLSLLQKEKSSKRVLLVGDTGVGKSWAVDSMEQDWASHPSPGLYCVIVLKFSDLNRVQGKTTLRELLKNQCKPLSSVLTQVLQNPQDVLIILDGLDEFGFQLQCDPLGSDLNLDSVAEVSVLVSKLISGHLLRDAKVLVTSRWNTKQLEVNKKHFDQRFIITGFSNDGLKRYCDMFYGEKEKAAIMYRCITENETIKCLASNPLNSYILCTILDRCFHCRDVTADSPMTNSKVFKLLLCCMINCKTNDIGETDLEYKSFKDTILKVGQLSFNNLLSAKVEMNAVDLKTYRIDQSLLSKYLSNLVLEKECNGESSFQFHHVVLKEQFAALYCATVLDNDPVELVKCLDLWCFGKRPQNQLSQLYLQSFRPEHTEKLYNFTRFLMGSLTARSEGKLWNNTVSLTPSVARALRTWFKTSLQRDINKAELLNLMHCLFELQDPCITTDVSPYMKSIDFFNMSLSPPDLSALRYCLKHCAVEKLDLRLCNIGDEGIKQLMDVLSKCKTLLISSNKLTEESAEILSGILQDPKCRIEMLSSGTNHFGSTGAGFLWKALAGNKSLKVLRLYDNGITDDGTKDMTQYLRLNTTLQKLFVCANNFSDVALRNIAQVEESCCGLQVITKIKDDEELFLRVETQVEELLSSYLKYDKEWLQKILTTILKDLEDDSCVPDQSTCARVTKVKANINKLLQKSKDTRINVPP